MSYTLYSLVRGAGSTRVAYLFTPEGALIAFASVPEVVHQASPLAMLAELAAATEAAGLTTTVEELAVLIPCDEPLCVGDPGVACLHDTPDRRCVECPFRGVPDWQVNRYPG